MTAVLPRAEASMLSPTGFQPDGRLQMDSDPAPAGSSSVVLLESGVNSLGVWSLRRVRRFEHESIQAHALRLHRLRMRHYFDTVTV
jgi:hypothetical protein